MHMRSHACRRPACIHAHCMHAGCVCTCICMRSVSLCGGVITSARVPVLFMQGCACMHARMHTCGFMQLPASACMQRQANATICMWHVQMIAHLLSTVYVRVHVCVHAVRTACIHPCMCMFHNSPTKVTMYSSGRLAVRLRSSITCRVYHVVQLGKCWCTQEF